MTQSLSKEPTRDVAEYNAYFPSPYSLSKYTSARTDFDGADYPNRYTGGKWKILMIASDERYILMENGKMFSTGNHPVEMLLPIYHLDAAGFEVDVATLSGNPVKLEMWAMPGEDAVVKAIYEKYLPKLRAPLKLSAVRADATAANSNYLAVFVPGGARCAGVHSPKPRGQRGTQVVHQQRSVCDLSLPRTRVSPFCFGWRGQGGGSLPWLRSMRLSR